MTKTDRELLQDAMIAIDLKTIPNWRKEKISREILERLSEIDNQEHERKIKPRIVKREGWVNVYTGTQSYITGHIVYASKDEARNESMGACVATTKIEWEEEE